MRRLTIPKTDLTVSVLGLGAGNFGTRSDRDESFRILDLFAESGGNFLDTAHIYAAWIPGGEGASERVIGEWIRARGARDAVVIGTKGGHPHLHSMDAPRLSPAEIERDLSESLERLGIETIDLYWLHRDDPNRPVAEIVETLARAVSEGRIRHYGVSNWSISRMEEASRYAEAKGLPALVGSQVGWSLAQRNPGIGDPTMRFMDSEMLGFHRATGLWVATYSSQANGFFAGAYGRDRIPPTPGVNPGVAQAYYNETNFERLDRCRDLAARLGREPNDIALGYLLSQPFPTVALIGPGTADHLRESCAAGDMILSPDEVAWLTGD